MVREVEVVQQVRRVDASFFSLFSFSFSLRLPPRSVTQRVTGSGGGGGGGGRGGGRELRGRLALLPEIAPLDP
jgi:hypothetical protein